MTIKEEMIYRGVVQFLSDVGGHLMEKPYKEAADAYEEVEFIRKNIIKEFFDKRRLHESLGC